MPLSNKHKALLITFCLTGSVFLSLFNMQLSLTKEMVVETFYDITPEPLTPEEEKLFEDKTSLKAETNRAFNETKTYKRFAQAYKPIAPPEDYEFKRNTADFEIETHKSRTTSKNINATELKKFKELQTVLETQKNNNKEAANTKSTTSYSLVNRTHRYLPTPIYLCEVGGKIVINITVNAEGSVIKTSVNSSSTSANQCLQEHALEYAKKATFNADSRPTQIGTITFYFKGK